MTKKKKKKECPIHLEVNFEMSVGSMHVALLKHRTDYTL